MHLEESVFLCVCASEGSTAAKQRQEIWRAKRVFFLTPQVMVNDLSRETCPAQQVKCVVIDEAHKALGNHAYCQVTTDRRSQPCHSFSKFPNQILLLSQCEVTPAGAFHLKLKG